MKICVRFLVILFLGSVLLTGILMLLTFSDYSSRHLLDPHLPLSQGLIRKSDANIAQAPDDEGIHKEGFIVHTAQCKIPDVDLWHSSVLPYVKKNVSSLNCDKTSKPDLTFTKGDLLLVNNTNIPYYGSLDFCEYVEIIRPLNKGDDSFDLGHKRYVFKDRIVVSKKEFIKVYCYSKNETMMYQNLHAFTPVKPLLKHMKDTLYLRHKRRGYLEHLNVLMVGIDSTSRLNFHRQFPKTLSVLKEKLNAYEMLGYNKVRDNTFINLVPLLLGKYVEDTGWNETSTETFDKHNYAWKRFASAGYHTLFAEDAPKISIWNFEKPGFSQPPTDYYFRPFSLAMATTKRMWHNNNHCFGEKLETDITLDYVHRFIRTRGRARHFAFTFLTRPTYDSVNQNTDASHYHFISRLIDDGLLEDTMVVYFSDHGARHGDILSTYLGKLEERLPALFVSLPAWFNRKYPQIAHHLEINQRRLTTPFDVNALLDNVLRFDGEPRQNISPGTRSISLFDMIPADRSCKSATIDDHWCTCLQQTAISTENPDVKQAAQVIVSNINEKTHSNRNKCAEYKLSKITDALQSNPEEKLLKFKLSMNDVIGRKEYYGEEALGRIIMYHISVEVSPGGGIYQGTVKYEASSDTYHLAGDISRTNVYRDTSWCVKDHRLKKYCFCQKKHIS